MTRIPPARAFLVAGGVATAAASHLGRATAFAPPAAGVVRRSDSVAHGGQQTRPTTASTPLSTVPSSSSSSSSALLALSLPDLSDAVYAAQSAASSLAATSGLSSGTYSGLSPASLGLLYGAGLLTSFSPCSLGLLPLTVSYISSAAGTDDADGKSGGTVGPTAAFAAGLASVFCGLGLSAALLGNVFGSSGGSGGDDNFLATVTLASLSGGVSIAMGLQLLELINLPLPSFELDVAKFESASPLNGSDGGSSSLLFDEEGNILPPEATKSETKREGGGGALLRTFLLGGSSALVASPCATPVLASILAYVASSRDPLIGSALLLTYTIGYTTPLLIIGASGGQALANARMAAERGEEGLMGKIGSFVTPATAAVLIWYGTGGMLEALLGDPSLAGLAPILE